MEFGEKHSWDLTPAKARALQKELAAEVNTAVPLGPVATVAAADVSYNKFDPWLFAAVVVVEAGTARVIEKVGVVGEAAFPYVPGLLSFREAPAVLQAFRSLRTRPDVVLCDGQGIAHPRGVGLACHLGLWLNVPTVGCAKSWLWGEYDEPGLNRGDRSPLVGHGVPVGAVVRTRARVKPVFVSPGHLCDIEGAVRAVLENTAKYRLPEAARLAHEHVNAMRREAGGSRPAD